MVQLKPSHNHYTPISANTLSQFQSMKEWPILAQKFFEDPDLTPYRIPPRSMGTDRAFTLLTKTLNTSSTFAAWQAFFNNAMVRLPERPYGDIINVVAIGQDLNGWLDTLHGGITAVLFDEVMGQIGFAHQDVGRLSLTVKMSIEYKRPIKTPGIVVLRAWLEEMKDKHVMVVKALIEDLNGTPYATAESVLREVPLSSFTQKL